ncbi:MAG: hypothetical protein GEU75_11795, partial [Dehalococcoidia bacterium]|nr:hypothetical protein [Dehalococcoidia bacterium]
HTVEYYATRIYQKLGVANRTQAAILAAGLSLAAEDPGAPEPSSREFQDALPVALSETPVLSERPRRKLVTLLGAGLGSAVLAAVAAIGLLAGLLPGSPVSNNALVGAKEQHCVGQPDYIVLAGGQPEPLPKKPVVCYETFDEAIESLDLDRHDYRPQP